MKKLILLAAFFCTLNVAFISLSPILTISHAQESPDPAPKPDPDPKPEAL